MTATPLFSIITVTLNNFNGLQKTFQSIQPQTHDDYEWIVIDGGSKDETLTFLQTHNIDHISEPDNGIYDAMNKGIARATGRYIIFMNAGDAFESNNTLFEIHPRIKAQNYDFIYGDSAEDIGDTIHFKRSRPHTRICEGMFTHHQAMLYAREFLKDFAYDAKYLIAADYDLTWRVLNKATNVLYVPFPICLFESGGVSQTNVLLGRIEQFRIRKTHKLATYRNILIFTKQTLVYKLRQIFPKLYWFLKSR